MDIINWADFDKIEIRVGTILSVSDFPEARNPSYKLEIDFGSIGVLRSSAQITVLYSKDELINKQIIAVINFAPKQIANFYSECLVLGVVGSHKEVILLQPDRKVDNGLRIG